MLNSQQLSGLMTIALFLMGMQPTIAQSNANIPTRTNRSKFQHIIFKPPSNQGKPKSTSSAGSRNQECPQDIKLTATSFNQTPVISLVSSKEQELNNIQFISLAYLTLNPSLYKGEGS